MNLPVLIGVVAQFFALMPWLGFRLLDLDMQPWALLLFLIFLVTQKSIVVLFPVSFLMVAIGSVISFIFSDNSFGFLALRGVLSYFYFIVVFVGFSTFIRNYGARKNIFIIVNIIWYLVALVEFINPDIKELLVLTRTTLDRGKTSLAPEPTYFAIYLFFSSWLILVLDGYSYKKSLMIHVLNVIFIIFIAKSTMGVLFLVLALGSFVFGAVLTHGFISTKVLPIYSLIIAMGVLLVVLLAGDQQNDRLQRVIADIFTNFSIKDIFFLDASMNERLESLVFSLHGAMLNAFIPVGFDNVQRHREYLLDYYQGYFWAAEISDKIMSWSGEWIYSLGIFGLLFLVILFRATFNKLRSQVNIAFLHVGLLAAILFSAIPISTPFVAMLFVLLNLYNPRRDSGATRENV